MSLRKSPQHILLTLMAAALILSACNMGASADSTPTVDINAMNTAIVGTTIAQISAQGTQTALAAPTNTSAPSDTPIPLPTLGSPTAEGGALPTFSLASPTPGTGFTQLPSTAPAGATASLGDACNNLAWEQDIGVQDYDILPPGYDFQKVWRVRNTGNCKWDEGYSLVYIGGSSPDLDPVNFDFKKSSDFVPGGSTKDLGVWLTTPCTPGQYEGHWRMRSDSGYFFGETLSVWVVVEKKC